MCKTCGCSDEAQVTVTAFGQPLSHAHHSVHTHDHGNVHAHDHSHHLHHHGHVAPKAAHRATIELEAAILAKNDHLAEHNRLWFTQHHILALNLVSGPGAGKTTVLERTLRDLKGELPISVIEGDQDTVLDAERIRATGAPVVQINTGAGCHLEAGMLAQGLDQLGPPADSVLMIENMGNLVCPALFDLGEAAKVVILSVTEGEDKPLKYPHLFRACRLMLLNKIDLLPHVPFRVDRCLEYARQVNPGLEVLAVSALTGEGLTAWYDWIRVQLNAQSIARA